METLPHARITGDPSVVISGIETDSRKVSPGSLFVALRGTQVDGHQFVGQVAQAGAAVIVLEHLPDRLSEGVTYVQVPDSAYALGMISAACYDHPSQGLKLVGVTGTNGKTSVVTFLFQLFRKLGHRCGMISTVQNQIEEEIIPTLHTTPDAPALNALLRRMKDSGCTFVFMEVSSHAVVQQRIAGLTFAGGVFTNITHDHLDFHQTFDNYIAAKKGFFDQLPEGAFALVNSDDRRGSIMVQNTRAAVHTFSMQRLAGFRGKLLSATLQGMQVILNSHEIWFRLIGRFNVYNLLAVYGVATLFGEPEESVLEEMSALTPPPGRFQQVYAPARQVTGIVDYAHTPDALANVLETIAQLRGYNEQVITVVGCGGNRDAAKRPKMAAIACKHSNRVVLTSDNPRFEDPAVILEQMQKGVSPVDFKKTKVIPDRREAIRWAVAQTQSGDIILVAGKGHETYQEIRGLREHFDDREELEAAFNTPG